MQFNPDWRAKQLESVVSYAVSDLSASGFLDEAHRIKREGDSLITDQCLQLSTALCMLSADDVADDIEAVFCHVRHDAEAIINAVASFRYYSPIVAFFVAGTEGEERGGEKPGRIFSGFTDWKRRLEEKGVPTDKIMGTKAVYNTPEEHAECVRIAKRYQMDSIAIVAHPTQMLRVALGLVAEMKRQEHWFRAYFVTPKVRLWLEDARGPQTSGPKERFEQIITEFKRILPYQIKGNLATFEELVMYLGMWRQNIRGGRVVLSLPDEVAV